MNSIFRRQNLPLLVTALVFVALFGAFSVCFRNFLSLRVVTNLFMNNAHVGVLAVGLTFVILSGGIDLSVGSVLAFTTILIATVIGRFHVHPVPAIALALAAGTVFGTGQGLLIQRYQLPPFLVTLAGMFLARGLAFVVSAKEMAIDHGFYKAVADFGVPLPGSVTFGFTACVFAGVFLAGLGMAHLTSFGRNVYAIGGNESSALLMGLPVARTKVLLYALSGFCAALGGVVFTVQAQSGNPLKRRGAEDRTVHIGGTLERRRRPGSRSTAFGVLI
jgi:simple sugar transport system permease protein